MRLFLMACGAGGRRLDTGGGARARHAESALIGDGAGGRAGHRRAVPRGRLQRQRHRHRWQRASQGVRARRREQRSAHDRFEPPQGLHGADVRLAMGDVAGGREGVGTRVGFADAECGRHDRDWAAGSRSRLARSRSAPSASAARSAATRMRSARRPASRKSRIC